MKILTLSPIPRVANPADAQRVTALTRAAAVNIAAHVRAQVDVSVQDDFGVARVLSPYRLEVHVGYYSPLGPKVPDEDLAQRRARRDRAPRVLGVDVRADPEWLIDPTLATKGAFGEEYAFSEHVEVEAAVAWVKRHCLRAPIDRCTAEDVLAWEAQTVTGNFGGDEASTITVQEAQGICGDCYRDKISVERLVRERGLSVVDAIAVDAAVRKILPRRRA